ncbi:MAG: 50S ribosomal protein L19 [Simkania sp.]|nr:50S ribosomal protein L19 [Simkania sp.]
MIQCKEIQALEEKQLKSSIPEFSVGDTLNIHTRIIEGEKERIQLFTGTVIARKGGGLSETVSLYRVAYGAGIERVFSIHSPRIAKIEVARRGKVRKAKLYYLRGASGKKAKVQGRIGGKAVAVETNTTQIDDTTASS